MYRISSSAWHLFLVASCAVFGLACGPGRVPSTEEQVKDSLGIHAAEGAVLVRFNPVPCDCPPFEVLAGSTWLRVQITASSLEDLPLEAVPDSFQSDEAVDPPPEQWFLVKLASGKILRCGNQTPYFEISLEGRKPPTEAPPQ